VVPIEEPDPLALLYMSMCRNRTRGSTGAASASSSSGGGMGGGAFRSSGVGTGVDNVGTRSDPVVVSLMSGEKAAPAVKQEGRSAVPYAVGEVIDLFAEDEGVDTGDFRETDRGTSVEWATTRGVAPETNAGELLDGSDAMSALGAAVVGAPPPEPEGYTIPDTLENKFDFDAWATAPQQLQPLSRSVLSNIVQDEDAEAYEGPSKQELEERALRAWSTAAPALSPRNNKFAGKFAPSLKKVDRNDSSSSLGRIAEHIEGIAVSAQPQDEACKHCD
jgi:hypothetical protein